MGPQPCSRFQYFYSLWPFPATGYKLPPLPALIFIKWAFNLESQKAAKGKAFLTAFDSQRVLA
jgi:hypothetical protein